MSELNIPLVITKISNMLNTEGQRKGVENIKKMLEHEGLLLFTESVEEIVQHIRRLFEKRSRGICEDATKLRVFMEFVLPDRYVSKSHFAVALAHCGYKIRFKKDGYYFQADVKYASKYQRKAARKAYLIEHGGRQTNVGY